MADALVTPATRFDLSGRVALLTGAGRGIGLAMARALAGAGCAVAIQDLDLTVAEVAAAAINDAGGRAVAFGGDVLDLALPAQLVADVVEQLGGLHVLFNNASIQDRKAWTDLSTAEMERDLRADLISPILLCQQVVPIFRRQRFGRIVNLGSVQQRNANPTMLPYSLAKAGLEKLTVGLARELAKDNVTVNLIAPGWIGNTVRNAEEFASVEEKDRAAKRAVPLGRLGEPEDMAGLALLLCSDAGSYITGQNIFVDGGFGQ